MDELFCDIISLKTDDKQNAQSKQSVNADVSAAKVERTTLLVLLLFHTTGADNFFSFDTANITYPQALRPDDKLASEASL